MKKIIFGFLTGAILFGTAGVYAGQYIASTNSYPVLLNGDQVDIEGYNINGYTYFKLRDIASLTGGFEVDFKNDTILLSKDGYHYDNKTECITSKFIHDGNDIGICLLEYDGHSIKVSEISDAAPHIDGNLYFDGDLIAENVHPKLFAREQYVYYSGKKGIFKLNISTLEKTQLLNTSDYYSISDIYGRYLYACGDFTPDTKVYDLYTDKLINEIPGSFNCVTDSGKVIYSVFDDVQIMPNARSLYKANPDGSESELLCGPNIIVIDIDNIDKGYVYYTEFLESLGGGQYNTRVDRITLKP